MDTAPPHTGMSRSPGTPFDERQRALILARPDMLTLSDFAERFGIRRDLLDKRHAAGHLLALRLDDRKRYRCPAWQGRMLADDSSRKRFEFLLDLLRAGDSWSRYRFFTTPSELLGGKTPVEAWKRSPPGQLEAAARAW